MVETFDKISESITKGLKILKNALKDPNKNTIVFDKDSIYIHGVDYYKLSLRDFHKLAKCGFIPGDGSSFDCVEDIMWYQYNIDIWYNGKGYDNIKAKHWTYLQDRLTTHCFKFHNRGYTK